MNTRRSWLQRLISGPLVLALLFVVGPVVAHADPDVPGPPPGIPGLPGLPWLPAPPAPTPDVPPAAPVTGVLDDWHKAVCAAGTFAPGSPTTVSRNWAGATSEGTCASRVNPGLENIVWVTQWTSNDQMTHALQSNFMALFASAVTDQSGIITFSVAQTSARPSLEPLTKFGFQISPVPPLD
jgi:hypothetical protein